MQVNTVTIEEYNLFRSYKGIRGFGYVTDTTDPKGTRLSNFILSDKLIRQDGRYEFTINHPMEPDRSYSLLIFSLLILPTECFTKQ